MGFLLLFGVTRFLFLLLLAVHPVGSSAILVSNIMGQAVSSTQFFLYGKRHFTKYVLDRMAHVVNMTDKHTRPMDPH